MAFWWGEIFPNGLMGCIPDGGESITLCDRREGWGPVPCANVLHPLTLSQHTVFFVAIGYDEYFLFVDLSS